LAFAVILLAACGSGNQTISGVLEAPCATTLETITIRDEAGKMIGRVEADQDESVGISNFRCRVPFSVNVAPADFYVFEIPGTVGDTFSHDELEKADFEVTLSFAEI
jgi:hypothetical protein